MLTTQQMQQLVVAARKVSMYAPLRLKRPSTQCYIPHHVVLEIRAILDAAGNDWRADHKAARP